MSISLYFLPGIRCLCFRVWIPLLLSYFAPFIVFAVIHIIQPFPKDTSEIIHIFSCTCHINYHINYWATITISLTSHTNQKLSWLGVNKEDLVQYKFAAIINQTEGATLLNYGSLDGGFYTVSGIVPNVKYFHKIMFREENTQLSRMNKIAILEKKKLILLL